MIELLIGLGGICVIWSVVAAILITRDLDKRGFKVSLIWLRFMIIKYLHEYSKITREETGRVGSLFYHYVVPLNLVLVIVVILAIITWA